MEISGPWGTVSERSGLVSPLCKQGLFYFWGGKKKKKIPVYLGMQKPTTRQGKTDLFLIHATFFQS